MGVAKSVLRAGAAAIVALSIASAANATTFNVGDVNSNGFFFLTNGTTPTSPIITARFGADYNVGAPSIAFSDSFLFTIPQDGLGSGNVSTSFTVSSNMLTLTDVIFNNVSYASSIVSGSSGSSFTINDLPIFNLQQNTLQIKGTVSGINGYSGNLTLASSAVPETSTWAMMVVGFGMLGFAARRRRTTTTVQFS